jgi:hypothetical protein
MIPVSYNRIDQYNFATGIVHSDSLAIFTGPSQTHIWWMHAGKTYTLVWRLGQVYLKVQDKSGYTKTYKRQKQLLLPFEGSNT